VPVWLMPAHELGDRGAGDAGEGGGATCVVQCSVTTRVGVEYAAGVDLQDESNHVGVSLLAAAHEGRQTLCVGDGECRS
jgi:hypothetical protein